jgi:flagellar basal body-associated protein FliL
VAPAAYPPNYNPDAPAYPPPANYPQQGFQQPPANYPQQGYPPSPPDYANYGTPPQQPYAPPIQPGQFDQPGQSGITAPGRPVQPPRKSRLGLWIALIIILLVVIIAAGGAYLYVNRSTPTKTLQAYCDALKTDNPQEAYNQLSTRIQSQTTLQRFTTSFNTAERLLDLPLLGGINTCTVNNVQENGTSATGTIVITLNNTSRSIPENASLVSENGTWKISTVNGPSIR